MIMYLRFVTPLIHPDSRVECGFFRARWYLQRLACPGWIFEELDREFDWFNDHLPTPGRTCRHFRRRTSLYGVCWFRDTARECIERARYCAWLLTEGGLPVETLTLPYARELMWRDDHQIVTPARRTPRAFRRDLPCRWYDE